MGSSTVFGFKLPDLQGDCRSSARDALLRLSGLGVKGLGLGASVSTRACNI